MKKKNFMYAAECSNRFTSSPVVFAAETQPVKEQADEGDASVYD